MNGGLGATTVASGALLGGNGTITGNLVNNGTVSPGYSPGTINVTGNYSQGATGTLVVQIASGTSFDKLAITGTATLAGTLQVDILGSFNPVGQTFTFLTAAGGVSGQFGTLTGNTAIINNPTLGAAVTYGANSVSFAIVQKSFASFGLTPNQRAIAAAAQAAPVLNAAIIALPNSAALPVAFNALSPQGYEIWSDLAFARATALSDRLTRDNGATPDHDSYYFDASQRRARAGADLDLGSSTYTSTSGLVGIDHAMTTGLTTGMFFSYGESVSGLGQTGSSTDEKDKLVGIRSAWTQNHWYANASYAYGWDRYDSVRSVVFPGTAAVATSNTDGHEWFVDLSAGRHFTKDDLTLSPFAGVLVSGWNTSGFTETGAGIYDNQVGHQATRSLRSQVGVEGKINWKVGTIALQPHVRAAFLHEFSNDARGIDATMDSIGYSVATRGAQANTGLFNVGLDAVLNPRALIYADYTAETGNVIKYLSDWRVGVSVRF
jgi:uncharacterized protein with beta-barrel porin domain